MDSVVTPHDPAAAAVAAALADARAAGAAWAATPLAQRLAVIERARRKLAADGPKLAALVSRPKADTLVAEILPLAEAARWLVREAPALLAVQRPRGRRPMWLAGVKAEIVREPAGVVLILAPGNYPLFLPGVQILQAIAVGNAVCAKPAPGQAAILRAFAAVLAASGLPANVLQVLDDTKEAGQAAAKAGFDLVVLTGSAETGRQVLGACAHTATPVIAELSGVDAVFVLPGADLGLVADCLAYGLRLNGGATCIAPRRVFVTAADAAALEILLVGKAATLPLADVPDATAKRLAAFAAEAIAGGARLITPMSQGKPVLLAGASARMALLHADVFAPWLALVPVASPETALAESARCPYALGASVFGPEDTARAFARRVRAGSVSVNDLIAPTADPRLPFGGRGRSGFGATRGAEGLLAMTSVKAVSVRRGRFRPHLATPHADDEHRFRALLAILHGSPAVRLAAMWQLAARR